MALLDFAILTAIMAPISAWILLLLNKQGAIEWLAVNGNAFFSEMAQCQFCLSWWTNVIVVLFVVLALNDGAMLLLSPFVATPITRKMLW